MAKASDLIGKRYGKLTVVSRSENNHKGNTMWLCKCDCGKEKIALGYDLTHGRTVSCGCNNVGKIAPTRKDLTGMRFGTLTVESISEEKSIRGNLSWNCVCDCGARVVVNGGNLKSGHTKSHSGCPLKEHTYNFIDLTGKKFGRLTVVNESSKIGQRIMWLCKCDCGNMKVVSANCLQSGRTKSCGCLSDENRRMPKKITHGMSRSRLYKEYMAMRGRCKPNYHNHNVYYGKGVCVCDEWLQPGGFERFREWAFENGYNDNLSLDRIDNDGSYSPDNCRWITMKEQQNNRSDNVFLEYNGEIKTMKQWSECLGMKYSLLKSRHYRGWTVPEILSEPNR